MGRPREPREPKYGQNGNQKAPKMTLSARHHIYNVFLSSVGASSPKFQAFLGPSRDVGLEHCFCLVLVLLCIGSLWFRLLHRGEHCELVSYIRLVSFVINALL